MGHTGHVLGSQAAEHARCRQPGDGSGADRDPVHVPVGEGRSPDRPAGRTDGPTDRDSPREDRQHRALATQVVLRVAGALQPVTHDRARNPQADAGPHELTEHRAPGGHHDLHPARGLRKRIDRRQQQPGSHDPGRCTHQCLPAPVKQNACHPDTASRTPTPSSARQPTLRIRGTAVAVSVTVGLRWNSVRTEPA